MKKNLKNINRNEHDQLMIKLSKDLEDKFAQLYEKIKDGETPRELWTYTFADPLMKHFEIGDLKKAIEFVISKESLLLNNWTDAGNKNDTIIENENKFKMMNFLSKAIKKHEVELIDVKNKKEELLDYKKLVVYFYPSREEKILELPETVPYVYEEDELQNQLEVPSKGEK